MSRYFASMIRGHGVWALLSVLCQALSIVVLKSAAQQCGKAFCSGQIPLYAVVGAFLVFRVLSWNIALRRGRLSNVYLYTALNPVVLLALSVIFLREHLGAGALVGSCMISVAIYLHRDEPA